MVIAKLRIDGCGTAKGAKLFEEEIEKHLEFW